MAIPRRSLPAAATLLGAGVGGFLFAADVGRALLGIGEALSPSLLASTALWYVAVFAGLGLVLGAASALRPGARPSLAFRVLAFSGIAFLGGMLANAVWLPVWSHPLSLAVDLGVLVLAAVLAVRVLPAPDGLRGILGWAAGIPVAGLAALVLSGLSDPESVPAPEERAARHPSVLLIVVDSLRADHTSLHGYHRDTTPNLATFSEGAYVFEQARVPAPWTKPSVASTLTGLPPAIHAAEERSTVLSADAVSLAERLRSAGYATGMFSDNVYVSGQFGLDQGFDRTIDLTTGMGVGGIGLDQRSLLGHLVNLVFVDTLAILPGGYRKARGAPGLLEEFHAWRTSLAGAKPWFAYFHFMEPHIPYSAPPPFDALYSGRPQEGELVPPAEKGLAPFRVGDPIPDTDRLALIDAYDAEIFYWDHRFAELIARLRADGALEDTIILVTADHGEAFYEHETWVHRSSLHEEALHVPLVIRVPGQTGSRVETPVSTISLLATILHLAGYDPPRDPRVVSDRLVPPPAEEREQFFRLTYPGTLEVGVLHGGVKWILSREGDLEVLQCFDLRDDLGERVNLAGGRPESAAERREELLGRALWQAEHALRGADAEISEEADQALRGFGYLK